MKNLNDLIFIVEKPTLDNTDKPNFVNKHSGYIIQEENIKVLKNSPVLLSELYGEFLMIEDHKIPEKANAILLGQKGLFPGIIERIIYSANYCNIKK